MKQTSIALLIGLFVVGCEGAKAPPAQPSAADQKKMQEQMQMQMQQMQMHGKPPGAGEAAPEKKDEEKKSDAPAEGDKADAPK